MRAARMEGEARRDQIAQAVLAIAAEHGVSALSVAAVAHRVGVAPSALYRHYPSKQAMLAGTLERIATRMLDNVARSRAASAGALEALERLLMLQIELVRENRGIPFVLFSEGLHQSPEHRRLLTEFVARFRGALLGLFREAQREGQVRPDLDPESLAVHFIGLYVPPAILWNLTGGRFDITGQARRAWAVFHQGIRAEGAPVPRTRSRGRAARAKEKTG